MISIHHIYILSNINLSIDYRSIGGDILNTILDFLKMCFPIASSVGVAASAI